MALSARLQHSITNISTCFPPTTPWNMKILTFHGRVGGKHVEMLVIACCNRAKSARNELYGRFNPYTEARKRFRALVHLYTTRQWQHLTWKSKNIDISGCIWEVKCVEILVKKCCNQAKSARNELYGRFNPYVEGLSRFRALVELNISPDKPNFTLESSKNIEISGLQIWWEQNMSKCWW